MLYLMPQEEGSYVHLDALLEILQQALHSQFCVTVLVGSR